MSILGVDRSVYEGIPSATAIHREVAAGSRFVINKACQGTVEDPVFRAAHAAYNGIVARGTFCLLDSRYPPKPQADKYWSILESTGIGEIPILWADYEKPVAGMKDSDYLLTPYHGWGPLYDFLERLKSLAGSIRRGIYTNWNMWNIAGPKQAAQNAYFAALDIWVASYRPSPLLPNGLTRYLFWQLSASDLNAAFGVGDIDQFNGSESEFAALVGSPAPQPAPQPQPQPIPIPQPPPTQSGTGLFYLKTRPEFNADLPADERLPDTGSFSQIGGSGQDNYVELDGRDYDFIARWGRNSELMAWALHPAGTIYTGEDKSAFHWPVILAASITGQPRNMVKVLERKPGLIGIDSIFASNYNDPSPASTPWLFGTMGTIGKDGHDFLGAHNGIPFIMPLFDPATFPGTAGKRNPGGLWIRDDVIHGPVATAQPKADLMLRIRIPALNVRILPNTSAPIVGQRKAGDLMTLDAVTVDSAGALWGHDAQGWSVLAFNSYVMEN